MWSTKPGYVSYLTAPMFIWWDVTSRCNLNCLHCYSRSGLSRREPDELSTEQAKQLIGELASLGVFYVYFLGGEPFMRPDFFSLISAARERHLGVMINTNGWFVTADCARHLALEGVHQVRVSVDGARPATHDAMRGMQGSFKKAVDAIGHLKEAGVPVVSVVATATKGNVSEIPALIDLAADLAVNDIQTLVVSSSGRGQDNFDALGLSETDAVWLRDVLERKRDEYTGRLAVFGVDGIMDGPCTKCLQTKGKIRADFMGCRAGRTCCNVTPSGDVVPCLHVRQPIAGNVRSVSFTDIWNTSAVFDGWRQKRTSYEECSECEYNSVCIRECPLSMSQTVAGPKSRLRALANASRVCSASARFC